MTNPVSNPVGHGNPYVAALAQQAPYGDDREGVAATAAAALSQQSSSASPTPSRRPAAARGSGSSRGVANLTPEQLIKKRQNDRLAQAAIRQRTRDTIGNLEKRIHELESQQPYQELQRALRERDQALAECNLLRRRLDQVAGIVGSQAIQAQPNLHELANLTAQQSPLPLAHQQPYVPGATGQPFEQTHLHPDLRSPQNAPAPTSRASAGSGSSPDANEAGLPLRFDHQRSPVAPQQAPSGGGRLGLNFLLDRANTSPTAPRPQRSQHADPGPTLPVWARFPADGQITCALDSLLFEIITDQSNRLASGVPPSEVLGPEYPSLGRLLDPGRTKETADRVSALLVDMMFKFPDVSRLAEQVAVIYVVFLVVRWRICPCESCYDRLPSWIRPIPAQFEQKHAIWNDYLPWQHIRATLSNAESPLSMDDFFIPYTSGLSLNWPYPDEQVLQQTTAADGSAEITINPVFEVHLRDLNNWSLGSEFRRVFPDLVDETVRIRDSPR